MISDLFPRISVDTVRHFCHSRFTAMLLIALLLCSTIQPFSADNNEDTAEGSTNTMNSQTSQSSSSSSPPSSANSGSSRTDNGGSSGQSAGGSDPLETNAVKMCILCNSLFLNSPFVLYKSRVKVVSLRGFQLCS